jgi:tRNA threonylcarbamoyladenosine biosynthesis protein TsaB
LFSSALGDAVRKNIRMNKLIIDAVSENIFLMIISNDNIYSISHKNSKTNYERLVILINEFLNSKNLKIQDISLIYVNKGPGSYAGIRNSLSIVKAIYVSKKIDYYCFSFDDFFDEKNIKYENIPNLCNKFKIKKNLIKPIYIS